MMKRTICTAATALLLLCVAAHEADAANAGPIDIGRMKVTLMPEYESQGLLVVQEGKFADRDAFPRYVEFTIPKGVEKLTDACSLSPGGQHFCQLYEIQKGADRNTVNVGLPYSDFFIDYKYSPFPVRENSKREFTYTVHSPYPIKVLEVHIQRPFRSEEFSVSPQTTETYMKKDFEYLKYTFSDVGAGEEKTFAIAYFKEDARPSVDIKYQSMGAQGLFGRYIGEMLLLGGLAGLALIFYIRKRRTAAAK